MLAVLFVTLGMLSQAADPEFDAFFKDYAAKRDGIVALEAGFEQRTVLPDEELKTTGTLLYITPRRIIFRTDDPERTTLVDDRHGYEHDPEIRQLQIFDIEDNPQADIFFLGFDSDTESLRKAYDVTLFTSADDPRGKRGIKIKPRADSKEEAYFLEVNLYLRDEDYLPYRIHIRNDEESQVFIEVGTIDKSVRPDPPMTQLFVPEDTKIVQNDRVVETVGPGGKRMPDALLLPPEPEKPAQPAAAETLPAPAVATKAAVAPETAAPEKETAVETPAAPAPKADSEPPKKPNPKSVGGRKISGTAGKTN